MLVPVQPYTMDMVQHGWFPITGHLLAFVIPSNLLLVTFAGFVLIWTYCGVLPF